MAARPRNIHHELLIDQACDRFEALFQSQACYPELESFLDSVGASQGDIPIDPAFRHELAIELIRLRISLTQRNGGNVDLESLKSELPQFSREIEAAVSSNREGGDRSRFVGESKPSGQAIFLQALNDQAWDATASTKFQRGDRLGAFELLEPLGQGGMGTVWQARQLEPVKREVALKLIRNGRFDPQMLSRFRGERQALAVLNHPHIAQMLDASQTDDGQPFLVMELVLGPPITEFADQQSLTLRQRIELFIPVCRAIQHAHQKGIIHRDLKPSNILVAAGNGGAVAKVIDFGLAKATETPLTDDSIHTQRGQVLGTPDYMSPEQTRLGQTDVDTRSDIYSLGAVFYDLLTGHKPFGDFRLPELPLDESLRIIRESEPLPPSQRVLQSVPSRINRPPKDLNENIESGQVAPVEPPELASKSIQNGLPAKASDQDKATAHDRLSWSKSLRGELDWIIAGCLEKDRARRYESAAALAADLQRYLAGEPVQIAPPSRAYQLKKLASRNGGLVASASAVFLTLALGLVATLVSLNWAWTEQSRATEAILNLRTSQAEVEKRASELEQVASFQSTLIGSIDPVLMGVTLRQEILEDAKSRFLENLSPEKKRPAVGMTSTPEEITKSQEPPPEKSAAELAEIDALANKEVGGLSDDLANTNFTDLAIASLKQVYFQPAIDRIDVQFQDLPLVRARLLDALAQAMAEQGAWELAETVQKKSLDIWETEVGKNDIRYWRSMQGLADIDGKNSNFLASSEKLVQVRDNFNKLIGKDDRETIQATSQLAYALQMNGDTARAIDLHQIVQDWIEKHSETESRFRLIAADRFAQTLDLAGRTTEAIKMSQDALAFADENDPSLQKDLIAFYTHFAKVLNDSAQVGKPIEQTMDQLFGEGSNATLHGQAQANFEAALELAKLAHGEEHPVTLEISNQLAIFKTFWLDWGYGVPYFEKALIVHERVLGKNHPQTLGVLVRLGESHFYLKQYELAIQRSQEAYDGLVKILGPDHSTILSLKSSIGIDLRAKGDLEAAYETLNDVYLRGLNDSSYQFFRQELAATCKVLQKKNRLREIAQEQLRFSAQRFEKGTFDYSTDLTFAWSCLMSAGAWEEAEPILRETVDIMMRLKPDHWETYDRQSTYGECLVKLRRFKEAEPWLIQGHKGLVKWREKLPHRWEDKIEFAMDRFIEFYAEQGNPELAEVWQVRLKEFTASRKSSK